VIWIGYTTQYREGGPKFARAAATLAAEKRAARASDEVVCQAVESKRDLVDAMEALRARGAALDELHFVGHSGMYGPMFRTTAMPEQFSPHEWRTLAAARAFPFASGGRAYFHACRSARWFAAFFARTFRVSAYGYHGYTTVSLRPDRFVWEGLRDKPAAPLYVVACAGKKSHGLTGTALKYLGRAPVETMTAFAPQAPDADPTYDAVSELYDRTFADITVREDEWRWLSARIPERGVRLLDLGCGNGSLLLQLAPRLSTGVGVDLSPRMLEKARARTAAFPQLSFVPVTGPTLPFPDGSFDVVTSLLSFRYLDWDPLMNEIRRVLAPGGRLLIVDMVTVPARLRELPALGRTKLRQLANEAARPTFRANLKRLVSHPDWQGMLRYNPIRAEHELRWYLESRFPGRKIATLNIARRTRMLAFDSGPLSPGWVPPQSYP